MLKSGNDCAVAIAEHISGNIDNFAKMMNELASEIGMTNTNFVNPHGLDDPNHYSTAYDMALLMAYARDIPLLKKVMNTKSITVDFGSFSKQLTNTNRLLSSYSPTVARKNWLYWKCK